VKGKPETHILKTQIQRVLSCVVISLGVAWALSLSAAAAGHDREPVQLGPGDLLQIRVAHSPDMSEKPVRLDGQGFVTLPMLGRVQAAGSVETLTTELTRRLQPYFKNPEVSIEILETKSKPVAVLGAVKAPGSYQIVNRPRLLDLITQAGGLDPDAGYSVRISRRREMGGFPVGLVKVVESDGYNVAEIQVTDLITGARPEQNIPILAEDVITVPRAQLIYVVGEVRRAGGFPLRDKETLSVLKVLSLAEGLSTTAATGRARIIRGKEGNREEIAVNVGRILSGKDADQPMQPEDILFIPSSTAKKALTRGLDTALQMGTGVVVWRR
jgi:polysaccharide biosynthesis/export protein